MAELQRSAATAGQLPRAAVIVDSAKAYDTVNRCCLLRFMASADWLLTANAAEGGRLLFARVDLCHRSLMVAEALDCWLPQCPELGSQWLGSGQLAPFKQFYACNKAMWATNARLRRSAEGFGNCECHLQPTAPDDNSSLLVARLAH
jgi:hypothetical protein